MTARHDGSCVTGFTDWQATQLVDGNDMKTGREQSMIRIVLSPGHISLSLTRQQVWHRLQLLVSDDGKRYRAQDSICLSFVISRKAEGKDKSRRFSVKFEQFTAAQNCGINL